MIFHRSKWMLGFIVITIIILIGIGQAKTDITDSGNIFEVDSCTYNYKSNLDTPLILQSMGMTISENILEVDNSIFNSNDNLKNHEISMTGEEEPNQNTVKLNNIDWDSKPVRVNVQVDLENENDIKYIYDILSEIESHGWVTSVYISGYFASENPEVIREIENRGHYIGIYGWKDEDLSLLTYSEQLELINKSISAVRNAASNPKYVIDFKPYNLKYNDDTIEALQNLNIKSITSTFSADESFVLCPYAKSVGKVTFPYPVSTDFSAVPISDVKIGSEEVLLDDNEVFNKISPNEYLSYLENEFDEHNETKDPMVMTISPSITGSDETKMRVFSQFLNYIEENGGVIKPTAPITVLTSYIPFLHITSAPSNAVPGETITITSEFNAALYCPNYYFRIYGKYPSEDGWTLFDEHYHGVQTGTFSFSKSFTIPEPPVDDSSFIIRVVGQGCAETCWPTPNSYERMDEVTVDIFSIKVIEIEALKDIDIRDRDGNDIIDPIWTLEDPSQYKPIADAMKDRVIWTYPGSLKIKTIIDATPTKPSWEPKSSYVWWISGTNKYDTGEIYGWEGEFNVDMPEEVGDYTLTLAFTLYDDENNEINFQYMEHDLYVTYENSKLSKPKTTWLDKATDWGSGATNPSEVGSKTNQGIYEESGWLYRDRNPGETYTWEDLVEGRFQRGNCYDFANVWMSLVKVLGIGASTKDTNGEFDNGFVTKPATALKPESLEGNAHLQGQPVDRWRFSAHCLGKHGIGIWSKYYDPTFGNQYNGIFDFIEWQQITEFRKEDSRIVADLTEGHKVYLINQFGNNGWGDFEYHSPSNPLNIKANDGAIFRGNYSVYGVDSDGDGVYNFLTIDAEVNVTTAGNYSIFGALKSNNTLITSRYSKYSTIPSGYALVVSEPGVRYVILNFSGEDIYDSRINGVYTVDLIILDKNGFIIDNKSFDTQAYSYTEFGEIPAALISSTDYRKDIAGDGSFDYLTAGISVNVTREMNYSIEGTLYSNEGYIITSAANHTYLVDTGIVYLNFNGTRIRKSEKDGPYILAVTLIDENYNQIDYEEYNTLAYSYTDFQAPQAEFIGTYSDFGTDVNGDGAYDYLTIEAGINTTTAGNYSITGWLYDNGNEIVSSNNHIYLNAGTNQVLLNFDGVMIYRYGIDGPYNLKYIALSDKNGTTIDVQSDAYITSAYNYIDFQSPSASFRDAYSDYGLDTNGDGLYEILLVDLEVNVTSAGNYTLTGWLYDTYGSSIIWDSDDVYLDQGIQSMNLNFNGNVIYDYGVNGPFNLSSLILSNENCTIVDYQRDAYITSAYNYADFQHGGIITGTVTDYNGDPVPDAHVYVIGPITTSTITDVNGSYTITSLQSGDYTIRIEPSNPNLMTELDYIYLSAGQIIDRDFSLEAAGSIEGNITDINGTGIPNIIIYLSGYETARYRTDENGHFIIPRLQAGTYTVNVDAYETDFEDNSTTANVILGQTTITNFILSEFQGGNIAGRVTDGNGTGISNVHITAYGLSYVDSFTNETGYYMIRKLLVGDYTITASPPYESNLASNSTTATVNLEETTIANLILAERGIIAGRVTDVNGIGIEYADVEAYNSTNGDWESDYTNETGYYEIIRLQAGDYAVTVSPPYGSNLLSNSTTATVNLGETTIANLILPEGGIIAGRITDVNGIGIPDADIYSINSTNGNWEYDYTNETGYYEIVGLQAGDYAVTVYPPYGSNLFINSTSATVNLGETTIANLILAEGGIIAGRVTDVNGIGIEYADVEAYNSTNGDWEYDYTNETGYYEIVGLQAGDYAVTVYPPYNTNFLSNSTIIAVNLGEIKIVNFILQEEELPIIIISFPTDEDTVTTSSITVSGSASDNVGLDKVEVKVGTGSWQTATGTASWSADVTLLEGQNTIYARANDTSENFNITSITVTYTPPNNILIQLNSGWNLISIPLIPEDTGIASVLFPIHGNYSIVWAYNASDTADHWKKHDPGAPFGNDLTTMEPGNGYWILMTSGDTFAVNGEVLGSTAIDLETGWNLIGYNSLVGQPITDALSSINGNYSIIWAYNASDSTDHWKKYDPDTPFGNDLANMDPGNGYWIMMTAEDILEI